MAAEERRESRSGTGSTTSLTAAMVSRTGSSATESYAAPYRSRSSRRVRHRTRAEDGRSRAHERSSHRPEDQRRRGREDGSARRSDSYPPTLITGSSSQHTLTPSASRSAHTLAQAAAPTLSPEDIDRLAEGIVARIQGRGPQLHERTESGAFAEGGWEEPPPPWSAPGHEPTSFARAG